MKQQQQQQQQQIEQLKNDENVLQFALPHGGRGFVTRNNELILSIGGKLNSYGHFKQSKSDGAFYFSYKNGRYDISEGLYCLDKELAKDLYAFSVKLGYFFSKYPTYKSSRDRDWDVLLSSNDSELHTPLYNSGFIIL